MTYALYMILVVFLSTLEGQPKSGIEYTHTHLYRY